jgi:hypothetical protein
MKFIGTVLKIVFAIIIALWILSKLITIQITFTPIG